MLMGFHYWTIALFEGKVSWDRYHLPGYWMIDQYLCQTDFQESMFDFVLSRKSRAHTLCMHVGTCNLHTCYTATPLRNGYRLPPASMVKSYQKETPFTYFTMNFGYPSPPNHHLCHMTRSRPGRTALHRGGDRFVTLATRSFWKAPFHFWKLPVFCAKPLCKHRPWSYPQAWHSGTCICSRSSVANNCSWSCRWWGSCCQSEQCLIVEL